MPSPSVPGSHAATIASASPMIGSSIIGRPEKRTTMVRSPEALTRFTRATSAGSRSRLLRSPCPSAYGVSPTTTMAACAPAAGSPAAE